MAASSGGKADIVRMLLRSQSVLDNIDAKDTTGKTGNKFRFDFVG
jgi:hypothetical protein